MRLSGRFVRLFYSPGVPPKATTFASQSLCLRFYESSLFAGEAFWRRNFCR
jgi:hypothetical protein